MSHLKALIFCGFLASALSSAAPLVFSTFQPTSIPESISPVPSGFGTFGGDFFVTDATNNPATDAPGLIQDVSASGGAPSVFAGTPLNPRTGLFLPPGFGTFGGQFAVANFTGNAIVGIDTQANLGAITVFDSTGAQSTLYSASNFFPSSLAIAPAGFGSLGGDLLVGFTGSTAGIAAIDPSGNRTDLLSLPAFAPFGEAFAPAGFGNLGGDLFITSDRTPFVGLVDGSGNLSTFANLPLPANHGLRFVEFAPAGFGQYGGDLIVSSAGSSLGSPNGMLFILNSSGNVVAELGGLNPRDVTFIDGGTEMLVNHADPGILEVAPSDFTPVPEAGSFALAGLGLAAVAIWRRRLTR